MGGNDVKMSIGKLGHDEECWIFSCYLPLQKSVSILLTDSFCCPFVSFGLFSSVHVHVHSVCMDILSVEFMRPHVCFCLPSPCGCFIFFATLKLRGGSSIVVNFIIFGDFYLSCGALVAHAAPSTFLACKPLFSLS